MKIRIFHIIIFFLLVLVAVGLFYTKIPVSFERDTPVMGTTARVKINGPGAPYLTRRALYEIKRLDGIFSRFNRESEIGLINSLAGRAPLQVSEDVFKIIETAVKINRLSKGAFDITLGHPDDLVLDKTLRKVYLKRGGVKVDLGGIGKGYAVESARRLLLKKGVKSAIIDIHSSIAVIGNGWRIGIRDPGNKDKVLGVVVLNDGEALSTSAQYEQPRHIIDPRSGKPANKCLSVTVIAKDAGLADALSTAVFVLGPREGMGLIKKLGLKAIIIDKNGIVYDNFGFKLR